jgi:hypothetical protein
MNPRPEEAHTWPEDLPFSQDYDPELYRWIEPGREPFVHQQVTILLDASGSTFNLGGRGRDRFSQRDIDHESTQSKTKPIIFSEMEAVVTCLYRLFKSYDLTGVSLFYYVFSSDCRLVYHLSSMSDPAAFLKDFARRLKLLTPPLRGGTQTLGALQQVGAVGHLDHALIILATDGQPGDDTSSGPDAGQGCGNELKKHPDSSLIVIGAGSVSDGVGMFGVCREGSYVHGDRSLLRGSSSECNTAFLAAILESSRVGVYLPACRDRTTGKYQILEEALEAFFRPESTPTYRVVLDSGLLSYSKDVSRALHSGRACLVEVDGKGWYLITRHYQLAIETNSNLTEVNIDLKRDPVLNRSYIELANHRELEISLDKMILRAKANDGLICIRQVLST